MPERLMSRCHADDAALPDPPQTDETKTQLLRVAERLFAQRGTAGVSLREIAREAGQRNTGAVHYHFGSREGVIEAIFALRAAEIDRAIRDLRGLKGELDRLVERAQELDPTDCDPNRVCHLIGAN